MGGRTTGHHRKSRCSCGRTVLGDVRARQRADRVTLFGRAANRLALVHDREAKVIDSGFGTHEVPSAGIRADVGGRQRQVIAELRGDLRDREEDGLVPTSFFRSLSVSAADGVVFDARVLPSNVLGWLRCLESLHHAA
jgi:hypothetical protein